MSYRRFGRSSAIAFALSVFSPGLAGVLPLSSCRQQVAPGSARHAASGIDPGPGRGMFLVAKPRTAADAGPFNKSVVLILRHGADGSLGLIITRATETSLSQVLPELELPGARSPVLFFGGPVAMNGLIFLYRSPNPRPSSVHVMEDVYFDGDRNALETLLREEKPGSELRLYVGHSGWAPGQLQSEIERGFWLVQLASAKTVFRENVDTLWDELVGQLTAAGERRPRLPSVGSTSLSLGAAPVLGAEYF